MSNLKILISGAGIAGGVFANCLLRAYPKANITIVERAPALRLTGASVDIRSSAVDIIKWMGLEREIRSHGTNEKGVSFVTAADKNIGTLGATGRSDVQSITSEFEIFRGALANVFLDPVIKQDVRLLFDETVESYEQSDDGIDVTFSKSQQRETYDLLVAADGLGSRIRGIMLDAKPREQIKDEGVHAAYFTIKKDLLTGSKLAKWYNAPGGRSIFLRPDPDPRGRTRGNFICITPAANVERKERLNRALREGNESYMRLMEEEFHDAGWKAEEVLEGMRESDDFYCSLFAQVRSPRLQDGRVVLLGDSGYATPGFGTSLAIMGSYTLAGELLRASGDVKTAAKRYEDLMIPFVKDSQGGEFAANAMQYMNPQSQWGISIRNAILGFVTWTRLDMLVIRMVTLLGIAEKKLVTPEYGWPLEKNEAKL